jgi:hypothetical protein
VCSDIYSICSICLYENVKITFFPVCILSIRESYQKVEFIKFECAEGLCFAQWHKVGCSIACIVMDRVSYSFIVMDGVSYSFIVMDRVSYSFIVMDRVSYSFIVTRTARDSHSYCNFCLVSLL